MNIRKVLLLATMAFAGLAVAPASASAIWMFYHEGDELVGQREVTFSGSIGFEVTGIGSFHCDVDATARLWTDDGLIDALHFDTESCVGTGALANCLLEDHALTGAALLTPRVSGNVEVKNLSIYNTFNAACALPDEVETINDPSGVMLQLIPDNANAISSFTMNGTVVQVGRAHGSGSYSPIATLHATGEIEIGGGLGGTYGTDDL